MRVFAVAALCLIGTPAFAEDEQPRTPCELALTKLDLATQLHTRASRGIPESGTKYAYDTVVEILTEAVELLLEDCGCEARE